MQDLTTIDDLNESIKGYKNSHSEYSDKKTIGFSITNNNAGNSIKKGDSELFFHELTRSYDESEYAAIIEDEGADPVDTNENRHMSSKQKKPEADSVEYEEKNYHNTNMSIKIDDNISFIEDEYETFEDFPDSEGIHASINQYKLKFLGSVKGMNEFKEFLKHTSGNKLIKFWLDCEFYRDSMQDYDQIENMATRNRLFR